MKRYVEELLLMVGGAKRSGSTASSQDHPGSMTVQAPLVNKEKAAASRRALVPQKKDLGRKEITAEEVIPLDEESFKDF